MSREKAFVDPGKIIDTAFLLINQKGYDEFSIRVLAEELGVTPMTLYNYAENKTDIIRRVILKGLKQISAQLEEEIRRDRTSPTLKNVYKLLSRVFRRFALENKPVYLLMFNTDLKDLRGNRELTEAYGGAFSLVKEQVSPDKTIDLKKEILLFEIVMNGLLLRHLNNPEDFPADRYEEMIDHALERLFPPAR